MGKLNAVEGARQKKEILEALKKLGDPLIPDEELFLKHYSEEGISRFAKMSNAEGNLTCRRHVQREQQIYLDVNLHALSAAAAKQIENAQGRRNE
jgi:hypothetical protein